MSKFEYPRLSRPEIVSILGEAQIVTISDHDFRNPSADFVSDVYTRILIFLDFLNEEDHGQIDFAAIEQLENPELHLDSFRTMKLYERIKEVVALLECPKRFTLKDLIKPDGDRTEYFISALLNFILHNETKMARLSPMVNELGLLEEQRKERDDKISELNAELANINESRERELPLVQEVDAKVKESHQTIANLNNRQASLRVSMRKLKEKIGEMDEKSSSAEFALVQSVQDNANLRSKLVQSPEKLQKSLEEKKLLREEAKNAERLAMQSVREKTAAEEVYEKVLRKMKKHIAKMQANQEQVNSSKSVDKDYKALKAKLSDDAVVEKSLEAKLLERRGKVEQLEELRRHLEKEHDAKCEEAMKELNQTKHQVESKRLNLEAQQINVNSVVAEVESIASQTESVKESALARQQELLSGQELIVKEFHEYLDSISVTV